MTDKFTKPKLKRTRIKNLTFVDDCIDESPESKFQKNQYENFKTKYEKSGKIVPLFFGFDGVDYRGNNIFQPLNMSKYWPNMPNQS